MIPQTLAAALAASILFGVWQTRTIYAMRTDAAEALATSAEAGRINERAASLKSHHAAVAQRKVDDDKDASLRRVRADAAADLDRLRNRPDSPTTVPGGVPTAAACTGATGAQLYRDHAGFLVGEAARADELRAELAACQAREVMRSQP